MANTEDSRVSNTTDSRTNDSDLETSSLKEAENLLLMVLSATAKSSTATALFMDEMASIILKEGLNPKLEVRNIHYSFVMSICKTFQFLVNFKWASC